MKRGLLALAALLLLPCAPAAARMTVRGSAQQVYVTGAHTGARLTLTRHGKRVARTRAGKLGGAIFRGVEPGGAYRVNGSRAVKVLSDRRAPPSTHGWRATVSITS